MYQSSKTDDLARVLEDSRDLVIVTGGDGTVGKMGKHLADSDVRISLFRQDGQQCG
jgi:diacylglycerol kinase family enzyme